MHALASITTWLMSPAFMEGAFMILRALIIFLVGGRIIRVLLSVLDRSFRQRLTSQQFLLITKIVTWGGWLLIGFTVINQLGFKIGTILGAAGVVSVAIAFAAQTSASNLISGIFLIFERPFQVGDVVTIGATTGAVYSIDLLSVKIRKFDNGFVRIPNETIIREQVTNVTNFPLRRLDINVGIAYKEDLMRARDILLKVAEEHPKALSDPEPIVVFTGFGSSSLDMMLGVWTMKQDFLEVRNGITYGIKKAFDEAKIEIPFPHVSVYAGEATTPMPLLMEMRTRRVGNESPAPAAPPANS